MAALSHINPHARRARKNTNVTSLFARLRSGDISALSQSITLIESKASHDQAYAKELLQLSLPYSGNSFRLGITGVPGVGKSTFIEAIGKHIITSGKKLAVLAIDPSSNLTRGSILGDKTRMEELVKSNQAYIRPSPAGDTLGGVARKTREAMILCEAAGYDYIIIETVGVGQSETAVHSMTDFFLLLKLAGAGDDLQGIKRGIMELADAVVINKADGANTIAATHARREFKNALHLLPPKSHGWPVKVHTCSGLNDQGVVELLEQLERFKEHVTSRNVLEHNRVQQELYWLEQTIEQSLTSRFYDRPEVQEKLIVYKQEIATRRISPYQAAHELLQLDR